MKDSLTTIEPKLTALNSDNQSFISDSEIKAAEEGLSENNIVPYLELIEKLQENLKSKESGVLKAFKREVDLKVKQQIAVAQEEFNQQVIQYKNQLQQELDNIAQEIKQSNSSVADKNQLYNQKVQEQSEKLQNYQQDLKNKIDADIQQFIAQQESVLTEINQFLKTPVTQGFQTARYDGDLQGTEVGMVLYYTDLLAKLWALDYLETTPEKHIADFEPLTKRATKLSSIYQPELKELPKTRLWFGHKDKGFQIANNGNSILMARNATRIYAASSNPLKPGAESTAAANSEAFLGWWNEHYSEVARYEHQYERLNEIMKWILVISWLNHSHQNKFLNFLQDVPVNHDYWFPDWVKANQEQLRFKEWATENCSENLNSAPDRSPVCFYPPDYQDLKTEAMPLLRSKTFTQFGENKFISGGVSLANRQLIAKQTPLPRFRKISDRSLRGNIDYKSAKLQDNLLSFETSDGVTYGMKISDSLGLVTAIAQDGAKLRNPDSELDNVEIAKQISRADEETKINLKAGNIDIGRFSSYKQGDTFVLKWQSLDIDVGQSLALELSSSKSEPINFLSSHPQVNSLAVQQNGSTYYVKLDNSTHWLKLAPGGGDSTEIPADWTSRIASIEDSSSFNYLLAWMSDADVKKQLSQGKAKEIAVVTQ
ncbi:MAG: hypothetical protein QNJ72_01510 [Pleurocapsa sp. MO_226.B13]|nr:hypothetical protein [Pleurocapsa sp. MO_226.B13]